MYSMNNPSITSVCDLFVFPTIIIAMSYMQLHIIYAIIIPLEGEKLTWLDAYLVKATAMTLQVISLPL